MLMTALEVFCWVYLIGFAASMAWCGYLVLSRRLFSVRHLLAAFFASYILSGIWPWLLWVHWRKSRSTTA